MAEIEIPWIISGPGVRKNHELKTSVNTYDTAVTAAWVFKLEIPDAWIGKPVRDAFLN